MITFLCPACRKQFQLSDTQGGNKINCSSCGQRILVPAGKKQTVLGVTVPPAKVNGSINETLQGVMAPEPGAAVPAGVLSASYCYLRLGERCGPVSFAKLKQLADNREVLPDALVWSSATKAWRPAREIAGLFPAKLLAATEPITKPSPVVPTAVLAPLPHAAWRSRFRQWLAFCRQYWQDRSQRQRWAIGSTAVVVLLVPLAVFLYTANNQESPVSDGSNPDPQQAKAAGNDAKASTLAKQTKTTGVDILLRCAPSVALIETPLGHGTGFLIGPNLLATDARVIDLATHPYIKVSFPSASDPPMQKPTSVQGIVFVDRKRNLAVLEVKTPLPPLALAAKASPEQSVTLIGTGGSGQGSVGKRDHVLTKAVIRTDATAEKPMELTADIKPGASGGAVLAASGEVVGIVVCRDSRVQAIPAAEIAALLEKSKSVSLQQKEKATAEHNVRAAFIRTVKAARIYDQGTEQIAAKWYPVRFAPGDVIAKDLRGACDNYLLFLQTKSLVPLLAMQDVNSSITKIGPDPLLSESLRQKMAKLWETYEVIRADFYKPAGRFDEYSARCRLNQIELGRLSVSLRVLLGVEEEELGVTFK